MSHARVALVERVSDLINRTFLEAGVAEQSTAELRHLATALLLDEQVGVALAPFELPEPDALRVALTDAKTFIEREAQFEKDAVEVAPGLRVAPATHQTLGDEVYEFLDRALGSNRVEGLDASLVLLAGVLHDVGVRARLHPLLDLRRLERTLGELIASQPSSEAWRDGRGPPAEVQTRT